MAELSDVLMMKALEDDNGHDTVVLTVRSVVFVSMSRALRELC